MTLTVFSKSKESIMSESKSGITNLYQRMSLWLDDIKQHELTDIVEFVEQFKLYAKAAESIPEEKIKQFVDNFEQDLKEFYQQNQAEIKHSSYLGLLNETFWSTLAMMTDKSQVEWAELVEDFEHQGQYQSGDSIGFGLLECNQCHHRIEISHYSEVSDCSECGNNTFVRLPLRP